MWSHWQNLTKWDQREDVEGKVPERFPWHGRAWLQPFGEAGETDRLSFQIEWAVLSACRSTGVYFQVGSGDGDSAVNVSVGVAGVFSIFLEIDGVFKMRPYREISLRFFDKAVWWCFWVNPHGDWNYKPPRWREGAFHPVDFLLGSPQYSSRVLESRDVDIVMPEGAYKAKIDLTEDSWKRPRWFSRKVVRRMKADMVEPIPHPGKGTAAYNCGDDALHGMTAPARTIEEGVGMIIADVLDKRRRYPL